MHSKADIKKDEYFPSIVKELMTGEKALEVGWPLSSQDLLFLEPFAKG